MPFVLLILMFTWNQSFNQTFGYGVILLGMMMAASSLILGLIGIALLARLAGRGESRAAVVVSTVIAFVPGIVYLWLLLA